MDNPFPGMDPWMEQQWGDAHHRLIIYASDALRLVLPPDLKPRVQERVFIDTAFGPERNIYPDLRVVQHARVRRPVPREVTATATATALAEPLVIELGDEPMTEGFIEIIDRSSGGKVVTIIEVLSPSNKRPGEGQRLYLQKQEECKAGDTNLVEIDLLRAGQRVLSVSEDRVPENYRTPYRVCAWRATRPLAAELYRLPLRDRLPAIRIPLRANDSDAALDLQPLVDLAYRNGTYDDTDYTREPVPPLDPADAAWADAVLREKGLR